LNSIDDFLPAFFKTLDELGIDYLVGGSFASSVWGQPRQTNDLDIALQLDLRAVPNFVAKLSPTFQLFEEEIEQTLADTDEYRAFQLLHQIALFKIDVFVPLLDDYVESEFARGRRVEIIPGVTAKCAAPENVLLRKLRWFVLGNRVSDRQWNDIVQVLEIQAGRLDEIYLDFWASEFGISDLLNEARTQSAR